MCIGTTMVMGQPTNRYNTIEIPPLSIYVMGKNMQKNEWHGICRTGFNRTVMGRFATISMF